MKTSNKLLIAFALSLILIPLLGMVYVSRVIYTAGNETDVVKKPDNFSTASKNMVALTAAAPFNSVNIGDAKDMTVSIHLIKDEKFGVKIADANKDLLTIEVDANGELQLLFKDNPKKEGNRHYINIYVYAPIINTLTIVHADGISLATEVDSLNLNLKTAGYISLEPQAKINKLNVMAENVKEFNVRDGRLKSLTLNLKNTTFKTTYSSYDNLSVTSAGEADVEIFGETYDSSNKYSIGNLTINTLDKSSVKVENIKVAKAAGHFSDQTQVQMPAVNLNQMYKK